MSKYDTYRSPDAPVPAQTKAWNMYGPGLENIGRDDQPEVFEVPEPGDDQLLVRIDAVSLCFSDVKLIQQGSKHPKLYNRDLRAEPTRLGHETALTVMKVGRNLQDRYYAGQRLAIQPDIYQNGVATAYGYTIPGGLIQYHLIGSEVLNADAGAYVLPIGEKLGYAEAALTEPWACVEGAYRQRRRLEPKAGGSLWIVGRPGDETAYAWSSGISAATIVLTDVNSSVRELVQQSHATVIERNNVAPGEYARLSQDLTDGGGFDDIVILDPRSAEAITEAAKLIAFRGTLNLVGREPLDGLPQIDVGRIHYHYTAYYGNSGPDIAASYGEAHNRSDLRPGGVTVFVGAGGPMGQMHIQRSIEMADGPALLIATDVNDERLEVLQQQFGLLAEERGKRFVLINPTKSERTLHELVRDLSDGRGADDVIVSVPVPAVMADAATLMAPDGMLVLFAGVPNGSLAPLNISDVYLHNAQFTGTSGSSLNDQEAVIRKAEAHELTPNRSVAAVGGIEAARNGIQAMMEGRYPGKIVIFPQISGLPLTGLDELAEKQPDVATALDPGNMWTPEAEQRLIEKFWQP
ncbi:MAG: zinc-binding dehydrogenase [Chloroflexi bacterium]|nr:zinc-binding dehydrogenase [Chloroflexota bacterium]